MWNKGFAKEVRRKITIYTGFSSLYVEFDVNISLICFKQYSSTKTTCLNTIAKFQKDKLYNKGLAKEVRRKFTISKGFSSLYIDYEVKINLICFKKYSSTKTTRLITIAKLQKD